MPPKDEIFTKKKNTEPGLLVHALYYMLFNGPIPKKQFEEKFFEYLLKNNLIFDDDLVILEGRKTRSKPQAIYQQLRNLAKSNKSLMTCPIVQETETHFQLHPEAFQEAKLLLKTSNANQNQAKETDRAQIFEIFSGPPGTGKTRKAKRVASQIIGVDDHQFWINGEPIQWSNQVKIVQFHPGMTYEEFIEGPKAFTDHFGDIKYEIVSGPMMQMIKRSSPDNLGNTFKLPGYIAGKTFYPLPGILSLYQIDFKDLYWDESEIEEIEPSSAPPKNEHLYTHLAVRSKVWTSEKNYILIIDEINRGQAPSILGELLYAIADIDDDRRSPVVSQHSGTLITFPKNLSIICTMNNSDRNTEPLDQALQRRFYQTQLLPDYNLLTSFNGRWEKVFGIKDIAQWLKSLNNFLCNELQSTDFQIGHSYLFKVLNKIPNNENFDAAINQQIREAAVKSLYKGIIPQVQNILGNDPQALKRVLEICGVGDIFDQDISSTTFVPAYRQEVLETLMKLENSEFLRSVEVIDLDFCMNLCPGFFGVFSLELPSAG